MWLKVVWKGLNRYLPKDAHQKSEGGQWAPIKKTRLLHLENVEKQLIRNFLRNGRLRVTVVNLTNFYLKFFPYLNFDASKNTPLNLTNKPQNKQNWI